MSYFPTTVTCTIISVSISSTPFSILSITMSFWTDKEEDALLQYLLDHKSEAGDGANFPNSVWQLKVRTLISAYTCALWHVYVLAKLYSILHHHHVMYVSWNFLMNSQNHLASSFVSQHPTLTVTDTIVFSIAAIMLVDQTISGRWTERKNGQLSLSRVSRPAHYI